MKVKKNAEKTETSWTEAKIKLGEAKLAQTGMIVRKSRMLRQLGQREYACFTKGIDDNKAFCGDGMINIGSDAWYDQKMVTSREL